MMLNCLWCGVIGADVVIEKIDASKTGIRAIDNIGLAIYCGLVVLYHVWFLASLIVGVSICGFHQNKLSRALGNIELFRDDLSHLTSAHLRIST